MCVILLRGPKECVRQLGTTDSFSSQQMLGIQAIKLWTQFLYRREFWKEIALLPQAEWFHVHTDPLKLVSQLPDMCWSLSHTLTSISKRPVTPLQLVCWGLCSCHTRALLSLQLWILPPLVIFYPLKQKQNERHTLKILEDFMTKYSILGSMLSRLVVFLHCTPTLTYFLEALLASTAAVYVEENA